MARKTVNIGSLFTPAIPGIFLTIPRLAATVYSQISPGKYCPIPAVMKNFLLSSYLRPPLQRQAFSCAMPLRLIKKTESFKQTMATHIVVRRRSLTSAHRPARVSRFPLPRDGKVVEAVFPPSRRRLAWITVGLRASNALHKRAKWYAPVDPWLFHLPLPRLVR